MEKVNYRITLDVHKGGIQKKLSGFFTGDVVSRRIAIGLTAGGVSCKLEGDNIAALMYVTKPSGVTNYGKCEIVDNTVYYDVLQADTDMDGIVEMQLKVMSSDMVLYAPRFSLEVQMGNSDDVAVASPQFTALEAAILKANEGKITPKGEWSPEVTYKELDYVTHKDSSFVALKPSVGREPVNGEFWMVSLDGVIDFKLLADGSVPAGDAKQLGGKDAALYAFKDDVANVDKKVAEIANNQIPEEYLEAAVDKYVEDNSAGFATQASLEAVETDLKSDLRKCVGANDIYRVKPFNMQIFNIEGNLLTNTSLLKGNSYITNDNGKIGFTESIELSSYIVPIEGKKYRLNTAIRCAVVSSDKETIVGDVLTNATEVDCTGGSYLIFSIKTTNIDNFYIVDSEKDFVTGERFSIKDEYVDNIFVNGQSLRYILALINGGETAYNFSFTPSGYFNSNLEIVETPNNPEFLNEKISIIGCEKIDLAVYSMSAAFCGFVTSNNEVIETWHENGLTTKQVPPNAHYLCVSHALYRDVETPSLTIYTKGIAEISKKANGVYDSLEKLDCRYKPTTKLHGVKWSANGDSITSNLTGWSYVPVVAEMLGIDDFVNNGVGGARFNALQSQALSETADIITLFAGTNDFGSSDGPTALDTFKSNVESVIDSVKNNTDSRVYVISPIPRFDKTVNSIGVSILDYVNTISEVCVRKKVPFLNLYEQVGITEENYQRYLVDMLHPTTDGKYRIAECIAKFISDMECVYRMI